MKRYPRRSKGRSVRARSCVGPEYRIGLSEYLLGPSSILTFLNTLELRISHLSRLSPFRWAHSLSCSLQECPIVVYFSSLDSPRSKLEGSYKRREGGNVPFGVLVLMIFFE